MAQAQKNYTINDRILVYLKIKVVNFNNGFHYTDYVPSIDPNAHLIIVQSCVNVFQKGVNAGELKTYKNENGMLLIENRDLLPEAEEQIHEHPEMEQEIRMNENNYGEATFIKAKATLKLAPATINFNDDFIMITYMNEQRIVPPDHYFTIRPELPAGARIYIYRIGENGEIIPFNGNVHDN